MLSVIIPAYNEAGAISRYPDQLLPALDRIGQEYEVLVVDDGSDDDTAARAQALGGRVRLVSHDANRGLSAALQTGIAAARGDVLVTLDADLTFAPELIPQLLHRFQGGDVDIVCGSPALAEFASDIPAWRIAISRAAGHVYAILLGRRLTAISPILRLYRREHLMEILPLQARGFEINAEILFEMIRRGRRIAEIPAPLTKRLEGQSKLNYRKELWRNIRLVSRIVLWRLGVYR